VEQNQKSKTVSSELLTEQQLAEQWHTTARHIRRLRVESELPYIKLGRFVRFDQADVAAWLAEHKSGPVAMSGTRRLARPA